MKIAKIIPALCFCIAALNAANAQEVRITADIPFVELELNGQFVVIERTQENNAVVTPVFAKTSRPCPPFCIQPMSAGQGVATVAEVEVIEFLQSSVQPSDGFLIDTRPKDFFAAGTIPGAINLPSTLFVAAETNPFLTPLISQLGGSQTNGEWDFSAAKPLMLFCNGPWCDQATEVVASLLSVGYPADKLFYYRGGMQSWLMFGLTVQVP